MRQGCAIEVDKFELAVVEDIDQKIDLFSQKIGTIKDMEWTKLLPYLRAATEIYPLAINFREMIEADNVAGEEKMLKEVNRILKKLIEETGEADDEFGSLEMPPILDSKPEWMRLLEESQN